MLVSIFSYFSIEMIAVAAGEARDPHLAITKAFRATMFRLAFFYLLTLALIVAMVPWTAANAGQSPFVKVMAGTHVPGAAGVINFVILIAALSAMNSQLYIATRMMFSLSRAGHAPRRFGELNSRRTARRAAALDSRHRTRSRAERSLSGRLIHADDGHFHVRRDVYLADDFHHASLLSPDHRHETLAFRMWGYPYTSLAGAGLMTAILLTTAFTREFRMTLVCGIPFLLVLAGVFLFRDRHAAVSPLAATEVRIPS